MKAEHEGTCPVSNACREGACNESGGGTGPSSCPVLAAAPADCKGAVRTLLSCRGFLWDVLLDGEWTGCARPIIRALIARHGGAAVSRAFGADGGEEA